MADAAGMNRWYKHGNCADPNASYGKDFFFPDERIPADVEKAKAVCRTCPVKWECFAYGFLSGQEEGMWGGMLTTRFSMFIAFQGELPTPLSEESLADFLRKRSDEMHSK